MKWKEIDEAASLVKGYENLQYIKFSFSYYFLKGKYCPSFVLNCITYIYVGVLDTEKGFAHSDLRPSFLHKRCSVLRHQIGKRRLVDAKDSFRAVTRRRLVRQLFIKVDMFQANTF